MRTDTTATLGNGTAIHYGTAGQTMTACGKRARTGTVTRLRDANGAPATCKTCLKMAKSRTTETPEPVTPTSTGRPTETVAVRIQRAQIEGNEMAALALADSPADQAAVDAAIDAGARWYRSADAYFLDMPGELSTLAIAFPDFTVDFGSGIDRFRPATPKPDTTPDMRAASAYFGRLLRSN